MSTIISEGERWHVTLESPDHVTYTFDSWGCFDPERSARALYDSHPSDSARIDWEKVVKYEREPVCQRGYGSRPGETPESTDQESADAEA